MNHYTIYELLWLFFLYSFGGWILETVLATLKQKKFANRGLVNGPYCVMYGFTAVLMTVGLQELTGFWLFLFAAVYATVAEWIGGHLMEWIFQCEMESGWIYLSSGISGLGRTGVYRCPVGQRAEPGSAASSSGACDEDIDPGVAAVPVCGCFCLFYAADRDQQKSEAVGRNGCTD